MHDRVQSALPALALFAKAPRPGRVKTRLAPVLSLKGAAEFHGLCAIGLWRRFSTDQRIEAYLYSDAQWPAFESEAGPERLRIQRGADLGARMLNCLRDLLADGHRKALIVGSDAPTLPQTQIEESLELLDRSSVVLGPSSDGGFTLIGAKQTRPDMFAGVGWSRHDTRDQCRSAIAAAGLAVRVTATQAFDVDTPRDLMRLANDPARPEFLEDWFRQTRLQCS